MATEEDIGMANYIMNILKSQPYVMMSWGIDLDTIRPITDSSDRCIACDLKDERRNNIKNKKDDH